MKAREIMTRDPECVTREDTIQRAAQIMRELNVGFVPVVDDRNSMRLTGVITDRDIAIRHVADQHDGECRVGDDMTGGDVSCVTPDSDVREVLRTMQRDQIRRVPVVEGDERRLVGVIAQADIATENVGDREVGETVERISEPGKPRR